MQATRRYWAVAGLGIFLAGLSLLVVQPFLLLGTAGIGAWLLAKQYAFIRTITRTIDALEIEQSLPRERVVAETKTTASIHAALSVKSPLDITVEAQPPVSATGSTNEDRTLTIEHGTREAATKMPLRWSVAGAFSFDQPVVTATDTDGLFREQLTRGSMPEVVVEPRSPTDIHVGAGGQQSTQAYDQHESRRRGGGLDPAELREYIPGDPTQRIDWKATARMNQPYVREHETELDYVTALLFDHRSTMASGRNGETKFDYARQVALAFVDSTRKVEDPLGYYAIDEQGSTDRYEPKIGQYELIKRRLQILQPTNSGESHSTGPVTHTSMTRHAEDQLTGVDPFDSTLRPYFDTTTHDTKTSHENPLFETARTHLPSLRGSLLTVLFTDDTHRAEVREMVRLARRNGDRVLVFLTPSVLFEPGGLTDLDAAYDRYLEFEEFRRQLARINRVSAFEVGPGDRLDAVLASGRRQRSDTQAIK